MAWNDYLNLVMDSAKKQYAKGQPYRAAVGGLLSGDTSALQELNKPSPVMPNEALDVAMTFAPMGITAYHGSPYRFDKFDPAKIGSGEGAQAYGHGLYFADNPKVAKSYQDTLGIQKTSMSQMANDNLSNYQITPSNIKHLHQVAVDKTIPIEKTAKVIKNANIALRDVPDDTLKNIISEFREQSKGSLYKVDIADEAIPKMLDFAKPLYKQSQAVKEIALEYMPALQERLKFTGGDGVFGLTGSDLFGVMQRYKPGGKKPIKGITGQDVTNKLMSKGIPGSKYLDQSSRFEGSGTSNYVVFDPEKIKILERNGLLTN